MTRRRQVLAFLSGATAVCMAGPLAVPSVTSASAVAAGRRQAVPAASSWGRAIEVPGLAALNKGGDADVRDVSCPSPGNCTAVGSYKDGRRHQQGFAVAEKNGRWSKAIKVPGLAVLNKGGDAEASSVSCASPGSCAAGGSYTDGRRHQQGFAVAEKRPLGQGDRGTWPGGTEQGRIR
jgi:hypothetical protein